MNTYKKIKKALTLLVLFVFVINLSACWKKEVKPASKTTFEVEVQKLENFPKQFIIKKTWKLIWEQEISVFSQVNWQVQQIFVENWDIIKKWQNLLKIKDNITNYNLQVQQAKVALENAKVQYQQTKINLQKAIDDAKLALERAENNLKTVIALSEQTIEKAKIDYENSLLTWNSLNYLSTNTTISDIQSQLKTLKDQFHTQWINIENFYNDSLYFVDNLFWVTNKYKINNDRFETFLSAKNQSLKSKIEREVFLAYWILSKIKKTNEKIGNNSNFSDEEWLEYLKDFESYYKQINALLDDVHSALEQSVASIYFPQSQIDAYISKTDLLQSQYQQLYQWFLTYKNSVLSLLKSTESWDNIIQQKIDLLQQKAITQQNMAKIAYETAKVNAQNNIFNAKQQVENAKLAYETAQKNYKTQLELLENQIHNAEIAYQKALTLASKLYVKSPIDWVVSQIFVDEWQEIWMWTLLFKLSSNNDPIVEIGLTKEEYKKMPDLTKILVKIDDKLITWHLLSVSKTAWPDWLYKAKIFTEQSVLLLWEVVDVFLYIKAKNYVLPLNIVKPSNSNKALIYLLKTKTTESTWQNYYIQPTIVNVWKVRWDEIELLSKLDPKSLIIISDIENYDPNLNILRKKKIKN